MTKKIWFIMLLAVSAVTAMAQKPLVGILVNGDACNIDWEKQLTHFDVINASVKTFLARQTDWNLEERLLKHKPDYCLIYAGLPDVLLQLQLTDIAAAYENLCVKLIKNNIAPIIITTLPVGDHPAVNAQLMLLNQQLKSYAAQNNVLCFDPGAGLVSENTLSKAYTSDGFMLNKSGLAVFAKSVSDYLDDLILLKNGAVVPPSAAANLVSGAIKSIAKSAPAKVKVVMLGNSITAGGGDWNKWLDRTDVRNAGQGGYTTGQIVWHIDSTVVKANPAVCFVMVGINDLFNDVPDDIIYRNQVLILNKLLSNNIKPVVELTLYTHANPELNKRVDKMNNALKKYCESKHIDCMDLNLLLSDENGLKKIYTTDGTHITDEAYKIWSAELKKYLREKNY
jgi:lysophospholipase L1-like esterase